MILRTKIIKHQEFYGLCIEQTYFIQHQKQLIIHKILKIVAK